MQGPVYSHLAPVRTRQQRLFLLQTTVDDALHELQVQDASQHLSHVEAGQVVPLELPRSLFAGAGVLLVALALLVWPRPHAVEAGPPEPIPEIVAVAQSIEEDLK